MELLKAAAWVEALAKGIDPTTCKPADRDDVINKVEVTRCLFYAAEVLKRCARKELSSNAKKPFNLSFAERRNFKFSERPISISEFARRINELRPDSMMKFNYERARNWLIQNGFLQVARSGSHSGCLPTEQGEKLGIRLEERTINGSDKLIVVYSKEAQEFLLDNLDSILKK